MNTTSSQPGSNRVLITVILVVILSTGSWPSAYSYTRTANVDTIDLLNSPEYLFADSVLEVTLKTDIKKLKKEKFKDQYQPATLTFPLPGGEVKTVNIRVKARGNFRKKYCHFPPLRLNFKDTTNEMSRYLHKLKLVTHCKEQSTRSQYILREYLVYKMFNIMTDKSFKVRLVKITYEDSENKQKTVTHNGFFIEAVDKLAERLDAIELEKKIHQERTNKDYINMVAVFQYMVGNTDWSVAGLHNIKLIKLKDPTEPRPYGIPYDFDYCGLVNTTYAIPNEALAIESVRERLYRGFCKPAEELTPTFTLFKEKKQDLYDLCESLEMLDERHRKYITQYLDGFYKIIDSPKSIDREFVRSCRNN